MMPRGFTTLLQKENFSKNLQHVNRTKTMRPVKQTNPNTLTPYEGNAKKHSADQIEKIMASIKRFGFTAPVLIDEAGMILAGHGRSVAAVQMGLKKIPCIVIDGLSETEKAAYVIADNKLADYGIEWDEEMLAAEIAKLEAEDFDLLSLGLSDAELDYFDVAEGEMPSLAEGDKSPFQQKTFSLADAQADIVDLAIKKAQEMGHGKSDQNENTNGNALAFVCKHFNETSK